MSGTIWQVVNTHTRGVMKQKHLEPKALTVNSNIKNIILILLSVNVQK